MINQIGFFGRVKRGWHIAMAGWSFIWQNPSTLIFPFISIIARAVIFIPFLGYVMIFVFKQEQLHPHTKINHIQLPPSMQVTYACLFFLAAFITNMMYVALSHYIAQKLQNKTASPFSSFGQAFSRFSTIFTWTLINVLLTFIFNWIRKKSTRW